MQLVQVTWKDSAKALDAWIKREAAEAFDLSTIESVGWLVAEDDEKIVMAASTTSEGSCGEVTAIPKAVIVNRRVVKEKRNGT